MKPTKQALFQRQTTLAEIGEKGQQLLQNAKVLIIGCGGLGSPAAVYLAGSGVGAIHLVDFDTVSLSNLHRQVFYTLADVGKPKAAVLAKFIQQRAPFTEVTFSKEAVSKNNILALVAQFDVVLDGTDSLPVKYLINDACVLQNKPLVYGSLYKFDGYVATFNVAQDGGKRTANLRDAFPSMATDIPNCEEAGTMNAIVGIIALQQANEVVKIISQTGELLVDKIQIYNALQNSNFSLKIKNTFDKVAIKKIFDAENYLTNTCSFQEEDLLISAKTLKQNLTEYAIIKVTDNQQIKATFSNAIEMPYQAFKAANFTPNFQLKYVVVCNKGITSYTITKALKEKFPTLKVWSLTGGISNY